MGSSFHSPGIIDISLQAFETCYIIIHCQSFSTTPHPTPDPTIVLYSIVPVSRWIEVRTPDWCLSIKDRRQKSLVCKINSYGHRKIHPTQTIAQQNTNHLSFEKAPMRKEFRKWFIKEHYKEADKEKANMNDANSPAYPGNTSTRLPNTPSARHVYSTGILLSNKERLNPKTNKKTNRKSIQETQRKTNESVVPLGTTRPAREFKPKCYWIVTKSSGERSGCQCNYQYKRRYDLTVVRQSDGDDKIGSYP